ncbi:flagellar hook-length control protein FliK [Pseudoduganella sp. GCM10020061]|uniref:flagellar hook-length control protein FliK n=1 Tax=Pseudoduganella sp. GCM10020061 TaxID=3317345 RepID=UPI00362D8642
MQAQTIPTSINAASAAPAGARGPAAAAPADATTPFAEALSREIGQRQQPADNLATDPAADLRPGAAATAAAQPHDAAAEAAADAAEEAALAADASAIAPVTDMLALAASLAQPARTAAPAAPKMGTDPISKMGTDPISASISAASIPAPLAQAAPEMGTDPISEMGSVPISGSVPGSGAAALAGAGRAEAVAAQKPAVEVHASGVTPRSPASAMFAQALVQAVQTVGTGAAARPEGEGGAQLRSMFASATQVSQAPVSITPGDTAQTVSDLLAGVVAQPAPARPAAAQPAQPAAAQGAQSQEELATLASAGEAMPEPVAAEAPAPAEAFATQLQAARTDQVQASAMAGGDRLAARVGTPAWDKQLGQKIVFMAAGAEQSASLTLNPPDLGPVQVVLNISNDQASVAFSSQQLEVRQALENAMPRLREMMGESGITLGSATVNAGMPEQQQQAQRGQDARAGGHNGNGNNRGNGVAADGDGAAPAAPVRRVANGVVDTFA